jgi:D-beta-D-heptose 7-phosphate kinase/D-beta-D-heptose 1-phosphate adenosyltransferase
MEPLAGRDTAAPEMTAEDAARLAALLGGFEAARVLCIGDVMLDHYVYGEVERISPEAPIPVLHVTREVRYPGGAGNVVRNLAALGARCCFLSLVGADDAGRELKWLTGESEQVEAHLLVERGRTTTVKTRYIAGTQQMLRADRETITPIGAAREDLLRLVDQAVTEYPVIVVSDYAKGVLGDGVATAIIARARAAGRTVIVDPKGRNYGRYRGATLVKPNRRELAEASGLPVGTPDEIVAAARRLIADAEVEALLVSLSQDGMMLVEADGAVHVLPAQAREVFDVSGAGDTAVAALATAIAAGASLADAARLANLAAGIVVAKVGTAVTYAAELADALGGIEHGSGPKPLPLPLAVDRIEAWRRQGLEIGFTNGCFDLLHPGHVSLLAQARAACDRLVVGLNSDASVRRLKGDSRPVQSEASRAAVLGSLASVDLVVVFEEDTPMNLLEAIRPDVLVKGADYTVETVVGADLVQSYGGRILLAELSPGHSTTATIARMNSK